MSTEEAFEEYRQRLMEAENQMAMSNLQQQAQQQYPPTDVNLMKEQLDLGDELKRIDYLLRSYTLVDGKWTPPEDENLIILSNKGVHIIREFVAWYVNKNTLLSNYEEETILTKMRNCAGTLNDLIYRDYENIFYKPSVDACKKELDKRLKEKADIRKLAYSYMSISKTDDEIRTELLHEIEDKIVGELENIRKELMRQKLKRFTAILRVVQDTIHSTYNRAWNGQERRTLRQHMQITETKGGFTMPPEVTKSGGIKKLFGR